MDYLAVKDLKKTKELWQKLEREKELVITRDGQPSALMISVSPETLDESLREIRRGLFAAALSRTRKRAEENPPDAGALEALIETSRTQRGIG